jgi:hypothetical protein
MSCAAMTDGAMGVVLLVLLVTGDAATVLGLR